MKYLQTFEEYSNIQEGDEDAIQEERELDKISSEILECQPNNIITVLDILEDEGCISTNEEFYKIVDEVFYKRFKKVEIKQDNPFVLFEVYKYFHTKFVAINQNGYVIMKFDKEVLKNWLTRRKWELYQKFDKEIVDYFFEGFKDLFPGSGNWRKKK